MYLNISINHDKEWPWIEPLHEKASHKTFSFHQSHNGYKGASRCWLAITVPPLNEGNIKKV